MARVSMTTTRSKLIAIWRRHFCTSSSRSKHECGSLPVRRKGCIVTYSFAGILGLRNHSNYVPLDGETCVSSTESWKQFRHHRPDPVWEATTQCFSDRLASMIAQTSIPNDSQQKGQGISMETDRVISLKTGVLVDGSSSSSIMLELLHQYLMNDRNSGEHRIEAQDIILFIQSSESSSPVENTLRNIQRDGILRGVQYTRVKATTTDRSGSWISELIPHIVQYPVRRLLLVNDFELDTMFVLRLLDSKGMVLKADSIAQIIDLSEMVPMIRPGSVFILRPFLSIAASDMQLLHQRFKIWKDHDESGPKSRYQFTSAGITRSSALESGQKSVVTPAESDAPALDLLFSGICANQNPIVQHSRRSSLTRDGSRKGNVEPRIPNVPANWTETVQILSHLMRGLQAAEKMVLMNALVYEQPALMVLSTHVFRATNKQPSSPCTPLIIRLRALRRALLKVCDSLTDESSMRLAEVLFDKIDSEAAPSQVSYAWGDVKATFSIQSRWSDVQPAVGGQVVNIPSMGQQRSGSPRHDSSMVVEIYPTASYQSKKPASILKHNEPAVFDGRFLTIWSSQPLDSSWHTVESSRIQFTDIQTKPESASKNPDVDDYFDNRILEIRYLTGHEWSQVGQVRAFLAKLRQSIPKYVLAACHPVIALRNAQSQFDPYHVVAIPGMGWTRSSIMYSNGKAHVQPIRDEASANKHQNVVYTGMSWVSQGDLH